MKLFWSRNLKNFQSYVIRMNQLKTLMKKVARWLVSRKKGMFRIHLEWFRWYTDHYQLGKLENDTNKRQEIN